MNIKFYKVVFSLFFAAVFLGSCKKWDDHNAITDAMAGKDLFQQISENGDLSTFTDLLRKSGYDQVISSSRTFTVFAPVNAALASLDPAIVADSARLRAFVGNHITNLVYTTTAGTGAQRIQMLNGKYNNMNGRLLEDANITVADRYAKNGMLHIVDKMLPALPNVWQLLETNATVPAAQKNYLLSIFRNVFNPATAVQIGVDPNTGLPVYQPGTDSIRTNVFWNNVYDLRDERKQYTFFVMADAAWDAEVNKFKPYFATGTADSTTNLASFEVVKDLAFEGYYLPNALPDTLISKFNTKVGIDRTKIVQSIKVSNGIVHVMSSLPVTPKGKFKDIIVQGESYSFSSANRAGNTYFRDKMNPVTGRQFRDVLVYQHGLALFNLGYNVRNVPSLKYKAYWVALNDNINGITGVFKQKIGIGTATSTILPYVNVNPNVYDEVYLGEFTLTSFQPLLQVFLTADNSTNASLNLIVLDYVRFEPVL
ncbi:fasciclin domain-containing protein [Aridibaculum aurantiacum]|uniref:fasciclin domain-containing protein n=1 Tax=Aridibaculum aurantiacum TaxID=2810307 RepID=UPI001A9794BD|nr:fasciclin domain-containing protein [Aridibaculum aurantiacum]